VPNMCRHALISSELLGNHAIQYGKNAGIGFGTARAFQYVSHGNWVTQFVHAIIHNIISQYAHKRGRCVFFFLNPGLNFFCIVEFFLTQWILLKFFLAFFGLWILYICWVRWSNIFSHNRLPKPFRLQGKLNAPAPNVVAIFRPVIELRNEMLAF
jgi:hypothetical protein